MAIQVRRGNEVDFDPSKMLPGEWAVSLDTRYVRMCVAPGICLRIATYEAFEADMAEIQSIVAEARTIEEAVARIQTEINDTAIVVEDYAILSKSYAVGGTGTRENEDADNSKYYYEQAKHISQGGNGLVPLGTIAFENLPTEDILTNAMYNISNDFTSDERFLDGGGILYGKGSNVFYTADGKWDVLAASDVKGVKGEAEDTFRQGNVNITKGNIGLENVDNTSDANKPISNEQQAEFDRIDDLLGNTDISNISNGTLTGAVDAVNENLEIIKKDVSRLDGGYGLFIGDSYVSTELPTYISNNLKLSGVYNYAIAGAGYVNGVGTNQHFGGQLNQAISDMSASEKEQISYVFILGGQNDSGHSTNDLLAQLGAIYDTAITNFPNAKVIALPLWYNKALTIENVTRFTLIYYYAILKGAITDRLSWAYLINPSYTFLEDGVHPTQTTLKILGSIIANVVRGGNYPLLDSTGVFTFNDVVTHSCDSAWFDGQNVHLKALVTAPSEGLTTPTELGYFSSCYAPRQSFYNRFITTNGTSIQIGVNTNGKLINYHTFSSNEGVFIDICYPLFDGGTM